MLGLYDLLVFSLSLCISLAVVVPLTGALVRFRANYNPKGLQLDAEGGVEPHTGPVVNSFFGMLFRAKRIEGWSGLYKGLMPTVLSALVLSLLLIALFDVSDPRSGAYNAPSVGPFATLAYSIMKMSIALPTVIITYRSITTPYKLPYFRLMDSLRVLLTPTERRRPWILYLTPGLLASQIAHIAYVVLGLHTARKLLLPELSSYGIPRPQDLPHVRLGLYFTLVILSTAILTPLEVIATRLAIQRTHAAPQFNSVSQEESGDSEEYVEYAGADEDVIGLRNEGQPYLGLVDCAKSIVREEGWTALYRAWWITLLGGLIGAFS